MHLNVIQRRRSLIPTILSSVPIAFTTAVGFAAFSASSFANLPAIAIVAIALPIFTTAGVCV